MSGFLAVMGKIGTFLLWVLFLVLKTATKIVGSLLAAPAEFQEDQQQGPEAAAAARRRSTPASPHRDPNEPASAPPAQLWNPLPPAYSASAPAADEYSLSSSFRRRASAPPPPVEDVVLSSSGYSRPPLAAAHAHSVSAPPLRAVEERAMLARAVAGGKRPRLERKYSKIVDQYHSLDEVIEALAQAGLESSNLIIGLDFTKSNEWTGKNSFNGMSLHHIGDTPNPYEQAISIIGQTLSAFDEDNLIPCYGFGDASTHDQDVFAFYPDERPCNGFQEALVRYREIIPHLRLSGPTSFAPIIEMATTIVEQSGGQYHVLVIIADGQVTRSIDTEFGQLSTQEQMTVDAIVQASEFPLSTILVGVGDGPWDMMKEFDDNIPTRSFDNFQFVNFAAIMSKKISQSKKETEFALSALMEIPLQYKATLELGILGRRLAKSPERVPLPPPFASYNTISRVPSRANSYRSVPSRPREEPTVDSTITASVTSPPAADTKVSEPQMCPVCLSKPRDLAFGCGHQTCSECGPQVIDCPICRRPIDTRVKLY
ncbi:E3 ubiquitin-protein ligase RGLG2-like [Phragmites australis]|uniref:E3 ubiquitin-protein ligase RGLG2-like n=1 Tax=Phragmites australis TaxID=29695 RepID=UPI002D770FDE|nr:E3 ubiquitin-protein ligase RGLG2-like [Phragmites australis]